MHTIVIGNFVSSNSETQQEVKSTFKQKSKFTAQWWNANKPSVENAKGTDAYPDSDEGYKAQSKMGNPNSFLRGLVTDDFKVVLSDQDITGGITPGSGGSDPGSGDMEG